MFWPEATPGSKVRFKLADVVCPDAEQVLDKLIDSLDRTMKVIQKCEMFLLKKNLIDKERCLENSGTRVAVIDSILNQVTERTKELSDSDRLIAG